ncbi:MAG: hypothetical protein IH948_08760, partial [Bacteroidetes bacterium]|nr:hypothetical protein [Bacteroidota bacterium]
MRNFIIIVALIIAPTVLFAQSWKVLPNSPLSGPWNFDDIFFINDNIGWVCDMNGKIWKTSDAGDSWTKVYDSPETIFRCLAFTDPLNGFCGNLGPGGWFPGGNDATILYQTTDGGLSWNGVTTIPTKDNPKGLCGIQAIDDQNIYAVGRYDGPAIFYKSTDGGATWTTKVIAGAKGLIDLHFFSPDTGLVGGRNGGGKIYYTTDGGNSFTTVASTEKDHVWKLFFIDRMNGYASVTNYDKAPNIYYYTKDGGLTWTKNTFGTGNPVYEELGIGFFTENLGWCGGGLDTYETTDAGVSFKQINFDGLYDDVINRIIRVNATTMYAAGARVYKYTDMSVG